MEAFLDSLLPRILGETVTFSLFQHQCKDRLLKDLPKRFAGYANYLSAGTKVIVLVDRDDDDCVELKRSIEEMAERSGLRVRSRSGRDDWQVSVRIAVEELEAWYFGEWQAITEAYHRVSPSVPSKAAFRESDAITGGTWEAFERVLKQYGYFKNGLRKIEAARAIGSRIDIDRSRSRSFQAFVDLLREAG